MRTVTCTEYKQETRTRTYTVCKRVPRTETRTQEYTVMVPEARTKTVNYTVCKPVYETKTRTYNVQVPYTEPREQTYTVCIPYQEERQATRTVTKRVPVTTYREVQVRGGHWECRTEEVPCSPCGGCGNSCDSCCCADPCAPATRTVTRRVWVPTCETKKVACTTYKCETEEVPYTYQVTRYRNEQRSRTVHVRKCRTEQRTQDY